MVPMKSGAFPNVKTDFLTTRSIFQKRKPLYFYKSDDILAQCFLVLFPVICSQQTFVAESMCATVSVIFVKKKKKRKKKVENNKQIFFTSEWLFHLLIF